MFDTLWEKFSAFTTHNQIIFILIVGLCVICVSWSTERILEEYVLGKKSLGRYALVIGIGLLVLGLIQHYIRHII